MVEGQHRMQTHPPSASLLLIYGPSGSGKSILLETIRDQLGIPVRILSKYSNRHPRQDDEDSGVTAGLRIPETHDLRYFNYGCEYALSTKEINDALSRGELAVTVVSNLRMLRRLKESYSREAVVAFVQRDVADDEINSFLERRGFDKDARQARLSSWRAAADARQREPELFDVTLYNSGVPLWLAQQLRAFFSVKRSTGTPMAWQRPAGEEATLAITAVSQELKRALAEDPRLLHSLQHRTFELLVADLLVDLGYNDVEVTAGSRDGGFDILAVRHSALGPILYLVECKRYSPGNKVGVEPVRQLYAVKNLMHANAAAVVTTSSFTSGATRFAQRVGYEMSLKDFEDLAELLRVYSHPCQGGLAGRR